MPELNGTPDTSLEPGGEREARERAGAERDAHDPAARLRGELFVGLDRLAFALEMEAADAISAGDEASAVRLEERRLGVRLAQRLVAGVHADEVDQRLENVRDAYDRRTGAVSG